MKVGDKIYDGRNKQSGRVYSKDADYIHVVWDGDENRGIPVKYIRSAVEHDFKVIVDNVQSLPDDLKETNKLLRRIIELLEEK